MTVTFTCKGVDFFFDDEDAHLLEGNYYWTVTRDGHLRRGEYIENVGVRSKPIHRIIMDITDSKVLVDHKDNNPCNNRRSNLRLTDNLGNSRNVSKWNKPTTSKHKGVSITNNGKFMMSIRTGTDKGRIRERYDNEDIAGYVYNNYALQYFGEFANLNNVPRFTQEEINNSRLTKNKNNKESPYVGVFWQNGTEKWLAQFYYNKERYRVGTFDCDYEAYIALTEKKKEMGIL